MDRGDWKNLGALSQGQNLRLFLRSHEAELKEIYVWRMDGVVEECGKVAREPFNGCVQKQVSIVVKVTAQRAFVRLNIQREVKGTDVESTVEFDALGNNAFHFKMRCFDVSILEHQMEKRRARKIAFRAYRAHDGIE